MLLELPTNSRLMSVFLAHKLKCYFLRVCIMGRPQGLFIEPDTYSLTLYANDFPLSLENQSFWLQGWWAIAICYLLIIHQELHSPIDLFWSFWDRVSHSFPGQPGTNLKWERKGRCRVDAASFGGHHPMVRNSLSRPWDEMASVNGSQKRECALTRMSGLHRAVTWVFWELVVLEWTCWEKTLPDDFVPLCGLIPSVLPLMSAELVLWSCLTEIVTVNGSSPKL